MGLLVAACSSVPPASTSLAPTPTAKPSVRLALRVCHEKAVAGAEPMLLEQQTLFVEPDILLSNEHIARAKAEQDATEAYCILLEMTDEGQRRFAKATSELVDQRIAILVNDEIIAAPIVRSPILGGSAMISGNYTKEEAQRIATGIAPP